MSVWLLMDLQMSIINFFFSFPEGILQCASKVLLQTKAVGSPELSILGSLIKFLMLRLKMWVVLLLCGLTGVYLDFGENDGYLFGSSYMYQFFLPDLYLLLTMGMWTTLSKFFNTRGPHTFCERW